jgi:hypothetical protein
MDEVRFIAHDYSWIHDCMVTHASDRVTLKPYGTEVEAFCASNKQGGVTMTGKEIIRPTWGDGARQQFAVEPSTGEMSVSDMRVTNTQASEGLVAGITQAQAEAGAHTLEQIAEENDLWEWEDDLTELSDGVRAAILRAAAKKPHARKGALLRAVADEFTISQAVEFKTWHGNLPEAKRNMLLEWANE